MKAASHSQRASHVERASTMSNQLTLIDCLRMSGQLRRQAEAKQAAYERERPGKEPDESAHPLVEIEKALNPPAQRLGDENMKPSLDWATLVAREPQLAGIRERRQSQPTAAEEARRRWEAEQRRR